MWLLILGTTMAGVIGCSKEADTKHENDKPKETTTKQKEEQQKVEQEEDKPVQEDQEQKQDDGTINEKEFLAYMEKLRPILSDQVTMGQLYDEIRKASANKQITDQELATLIFEKVIPMALNIEERLEAVLPSKSLREIHEKFIKMAQLNRQGMEEIVKAVDTGDYSLINKANAYFAEARALDRELAYFLEDMAQKFNINLDGSKDSL